LGDNITEMLLKVEDIHTYYGRSYILQGVSLEINQGETVALLGRNGVGKTTTLKSIMGTQPPRSGRVLFEGKNISGIPPYQIAKRGIAHVPDTRRIIPNLTVRENLKLAMLKDRERNKDQLLDMAFSYFPRLKERLNNRGTMLSGGEQQMLAIARGLVSNPKLMLIDEPTEGLMPILVQTLTKNLKALQESGLTMLLVEANLQVALEIAQRVYVLEKGIIKFSGTSAQLLEGKEIQKRFLGVSV
jgi:branched-chain amino acid transport system ATP-binding protein